MLIDWEATMSNEEHGRRSGQHEQKRQQAVLPGCCDEQIPEIGVHVQVHPGMSKEDVEDWILAFFKHPSRIQIKHFEVKA